MVTVKRVGILSFGVISAILSVIGSLIFGLIMMGGLSILNSFAETYGEFELPQIYTVSGVTWLVIMPLVYAGIGFIGGAILAALYNLVSRWVGGIQLQIETEPVVAQPEPQNTETGVI